MLYNGARLHGLGHPHLVVLVRLAPHQHLEDNVTILR